MNVWTLLGRVTVDASDAKRGLQDSERAAKDAGRGMERAIDDSVRKSTRRLNDLGRSMQQAGAQWSMRVTAPIAALSGVILKVAGDFESSMNRVGALTSATGDEMDRLNGLARQLGSTTAFSASQAADAMGFLAQAGFEVEEIYQALPGTLQLAAAGQLDLAAAADIASNVLTGMGLAASEINRVNDVMAATSAKANTNISQLGEAFKFAGPVASALGISVEEAGAAMGLLSNAGLQASSAGTGLRQILSTLVLKADETGVATRDAAGNMRPLADMLADLEARGFTAEQAMAAFGQRGGPALLALLSQGSGALRDFTTDLEGAGGTAKRLADAQMAGLNGALLKLKSAAEAVGLAIAASGLLEWATSMAERLAGLLTRVSETNPALLRLGVTIAGIAAAVGPVLLAVGQAVRVFASMRTAALLLGGALRAAMLNPVGLIATAIAGLYFAWQQNLGGIQEITGRVLDSVRPMFDGLRDTFTGLLTEWARFASALAETAAPLLASLRQAFSSLQATIAGAWAEVGDDVVAALGWLLRKTVVVIEGVIAAITTIISAGASVVENWESVAFWWREMLDGMNWIAEQTGIAILEAMRIASLKTQRAFSVMFQALESGFAFIINAVIGGVNLLVDGINAAFGWTGTQIERVQGVVMTAWAETTQELAEGASAATDRLTQAQAEIASEIRHLRAVTATTIDIIRRGMARGVTAVDAVTEAAAGAGGAIEDLLEPIGLTIEGLAEMGDAAETGVAAAARAIEDDLVAGSLAYLKRKNREAWAAFEAAATDEARRAALSIVNETEAAIDAIEERFAALDLEVPIKIVITREDGTIPWTELGPDSFGLARPDLTPRAPQPARARPPAPGATLPGADAWRPPTLYELDALANLPDLIEQGAKRGVTEGVLEGMSVTVAPARALGLTPDVTVNQERLARVRDREARVERYAAREATTARWGDGTAWADARLGPALDLKVEPTIQVAEPRDIPTAGILDALKTSADEAADRLTAHADAAQAAKDAETAALEARIAKSQRLVDAINGFADTIFGSVPLLSSVLEGFTLSVDESTGRLRVSFSPMQMFADLLGQLLGQSESFRAFLQEASERLQPFADRLGELMALALAPLLDAFFALLEAIWPVVEVAVRLFTAALRPLVAVIQAVVVPVFSWLANAIVAIYNALLGWLFGRIEADTPSAAPTPKDGGTGSGSGSAGTPTATYTGTGNTGGFRYQNITAPVGSIAAYNQQIAALRAFINNAGPYDQQYVPAAQEQIAHMEFLKSQIAPDPKPTAPAPTAPRAPTFTAPAPPRLVTPRDPTGLMADLERQRQEVVNQLAWAGAEADIAALNLQLRDIDDELSRLRNLGLDQAFGDRPTWWAGEDGEEPNFSIVSQSLQLAVATPLVEASDMMLEAATLMRATLNDLAPADGARGLNVLPPFTEAIGRLTPVLERLLDEGVNVQTTAANTLTAGVPWWSVLRTTLVRTA